MKKGKIGKVYGTAVAIEHNADGSVTIYRELAEEIVADKRLPKWLRSYFERPKRLFMKGNAE